MPGPEEIDLCCKGLMYNYNNGSFSRIVFDSQVNPHHNACCSMIDPRTCNNTAEAQ